jgi:dUTP pyrophosphatase
MKTLEELNEYVNHLDNYIDVLETRVKWLEENTLNKVKEPEITIPYIDFGIDELTKVPERKREGDCGFDAYALETVTIPANGTAKVPLGIGVIVPEPFGIKAETRSGNFLKGLNVGQAWVDRNYRGQINALMQNITTQDIVINKGDRPCSIDLIYSYKMNFVPAKEYFGEEKYNELMDTNRGASAFGSSGN